MYLYHRMGLAMIPDEEVGLAAPVSTGAGRIVNLLDIMELFQIDRFLRLLSIYQIMTEHYVKDAIKSSNDDDKMDISWLKDNLSKLMSDCTKLHFPCTANVLWKILSNEKMASGELLQLLSQLTDRLIEESGTRNFFTLTMEDHRMYMKWTQGWEKAIERFPEAQDDIREAHRCFALGRYSVSMHHVLHVAEHGVVAVGKFIGTKKDKLWFGPVCSDLEIIMRRKKSDYRGWKRKHYDFLEQVLSSADQIRKPLRNKVDHANGRLVVIDPQFPIEIAQEVMAAVRGFMRRLAVELPQRRSSPPVRGADQNAAGQSSQGQAQKPSSGATN